MGAIIILVIIVLVLVHFKKYDQRIKNLENSVLSQQKIITFQKEAIEHHQDFMNIILKNANIVDTI